MLDETIRAVQELGETKTNVGLPLDSDGFLDRECPSPECEFDFKVQVDDWRDKVRDEEVFCPFCRHAATSDKWFTQEQAEIINDAILKMTTGIDDALKKDAEAWNRRQPPNAFIRITMQVNELPRHIFLPPEAAELMRLKITCSACACRYAVIGAAFFCPACGHNAADHLFVQSISGIARVLDSLPHIRVALPDRDVAEVMARQAIENGLQNAVTSFQRYAEALYGRFPSAAAARRNAFQNLKEGSALWKGVSGKDFADFLGTNEVAILTRMFQQRHLLAHTEGLVDQDYIVRSGDTSYGVGQRIVVREPSVHEFLTILRKLAESMAKHCP